MKFDATISQTFGKATRQTHASRFCMIKFPSVLIRAWWLTWYWLNSQRHSIWLAMIYLMKKLSAIGFSNHTIGWFKLHLSNILFRVNLGNCYSNSSNISCWVLKGSSPGPLLFLIYVNNMYQAVKSNPFLYAIDSCRIFQGRDDIEI